MIAGIENAGIALFRSAEPALGYRWLTLESYPDDWDDYFKNKTQLNAPAAWFTFGGIEQVQDSNDGAIATMSIGVVVAARNLRNETATRHGFGTAGGREIGSYQLLLDAVGLLHGSDLGLDISRLMLVRAVQVNLGGLAFARNASMWALQFRTSATIPPLQIEDGEPVDFTVFHANWDVPPLGNVDTDPDAPGVQLPADATADATDHVRLNP